MYERFTERARALMNGARSIAFGLKHEYIGTEHMLLSLIKDEKSKAFYILRQFGITPSDLEEKVKSRITIGTEDPVSESALPVTPRVKKVLEYAMEEVRCLNHRSLVATEHILLGFLRCAESVAHDVLLEALKDIIADGDIYKVINQIREELINGIYLVPRDQTLGQFNLTLAQKLEEVFDLSSWSDLEVKRLQEVLLSDPSKLVEEINLASHKRIVSDNAIELSQAITLHACSTSEEFNKEGINISAMATVNAISSILKFQPSFGNTALKSSILELLKD